VSLIKIRADERAHKRTKTFEKRLVPAAAGRDIIPLKRPERHAIIYHVMRLIDLPMDLFLCLQPYTSVTASRIRQHFLARHHLLPAKPP
jgi:hypothetical protein